MIPRFDAESIGQGRNTPRFGAAQSGNDTGNEQQAA